MRRLSNKLRRVTNGLGAARRLKAKVHVKHKNAKRTCSQICSPIKAIFGFMMSIVAFIIFDLIGNVLGFLSGLVVWRTTRPTNAKLAAGRNLTRVQKGLHW